MKIFHEIKTAIFSSSVEPYLSLGFDFCYSNNSINLDDMASNAGFIIFSYPNISLEKNFDFIYYAFNNNINYIIVDLMEDSKIENNIFGYKISSIIINYPEDIEGVNYILVNSEEILDLYYVDPDDSLIKIVLEEGYSIAQMDIIFYYQLVIIPSDNITEFNEFCDEINDDYGDKNEKNSYPFENKYSIPNYYHINITENLENVCNDINCILCLEKDLNYCIVCKGNYTFIYDDKYIYGKKKICKGIENETNTDNFSHDNIILSDIKTDELTNNEKINSDKLTYKMEITNDIKIDDSSNEKHLIKTNEMNNRIESSNINVNKMLTDINSEINSDNNDNSNEISSSSHFSNSYKDALSNSKEEKSDETTVKISNENYMIGVSDNSLSYDISSDKISYLLNSDKLTENKTISDWNTFENVTDIIKDEISNKNSIISYINENMITNDYDSASNQNIINSEKISYVNNISNDNLLISDISTNNNEIFIEELINGKFKDINFSNEQLKKLYEDIKKYIFEKYNGDNIIMITGNVKIQISNVDTQKYSEELSNIDLGECGEILIKKYCKTENDSLIMLKFDFKPENETSTYVQYEIYEPLSKIFLELEECSENKISIDAPIELEPEIENLCEWLLQSGYNLFDSNDRFYNDICSVYTTQKGTDILLYDRRMDIYQLTINISLCQDGCDFQSYNIAKKKAKCNCIIKKNKINTDISEFKFYKNTMIEQFYETLDNSNFRVLICYKLAFNIKIFKNNIGSIFMTILLILLVILIILYLVIQSQKINEFIQIIIKSKFFINNNSSKSKLNKQIGEYEKKIKICKYIIIKMKLKKIKVKV